MATRITSIAMALHSAYLPAENYQHMGICGAFNSHSAKVDQLADFSVSHYECATATERHSSCAHRTSA
jgi:hypothetical protein